MRNVNMYSYKQKNEFALQWLNVNLKKLHSFCIFLSVFLKYMLLYYQILKISYMTFL